MATNLRLRQETQDALRAEAGRTGSSQQQLIRDAVDRFLGLGAPSSEGSDGERERRLAEAGTRPPRLPFRELDDLVLLPPGVTGDDLVDRGERL
ncbi:MAG: hypothetical protein M3Y06_04775 [Actinomycetota bacterium]|nr:hypothetical protein [Actinomycetota bacterium]